VNIRQVLAAAAAVSALSAPLAAQWHTYPTAGIPRLSSGKPNLSAPTPRKPNGQPDLSGIWQVPGLKYLINIAADLTEVPFQPWAETTYKERLTNFGKDDPNNLCLPSVVPEKIAVTSFAKKTTKTRSISSANRWGRGRAAWRVRVFVRG
jgi:hypothetical protein